MLTESGQILFEYERALFESVWTLIESRRRLSEYGQIFCGISSEYGQGQILCECGKMCCESDKALFDSGQILCESDPILFESGWMVLESGRVLTSDIV